MGIPCNSLKALSYIYWLPQKDHGGSPENSQLGQADLPHLWPLLLGNPSVPFIINQIRPSRLAIHEKLPPPPGRRGFKVGWGGPGAMRSGHHSLPTQRLSALLGLGPEFTVYEGNC